VFRKVTFTLNFVAFMAHALFGCCSHHLFAADTCGHSHYDHLGVGVRSLDSVVPTPPAHGSCCHHERRTKTDPVASGKDHVAQVSTSESLVSDSSRSLPCDTAHKCDHDRCDFIGSDSSVLIVKACWVRVALHPRDLLGNESVCLQRLERNQLPNDSSSPLRLCAQHQSWQV
jgi:hypothetical protein